MEQVFTSQMFAYSKAPVNKYWVGLMLELIEKWASQCPHLKISGIQAIRVKLSLICVAGVLKSV